MRTVLVTGSDTGVGKTQVVAALARLLAVRGARVRIVKPLETGAPPEGDAIRARRLSGQSVEAVTLFSFPKPLAPVAAASREHVELSLEDLVERLNALPPCDWRIVEGAGGIATPIDGDGRDWSDLAGALQVDALVVVVADRLGAINQARLALVRARASGRPAGVWLNATEPLDAGVAASNRDGLHACGVPVWAEQGFNSIEPLDPVTAIENLTSTSEERSGGARRQMSELPGAKPEAVPDRASAADPAWLRRGRDALAERAKKGTLRAVHVTRSEDFLNLADNDYLALARDHAVVEALASAAREYGTSASASPLITGWRAPHAALVDELSRWHGFDFGLLWTSGFAANSAVLGVLPGRGDLVLADRLIHHSMIAGILRSGARLQRYDHLRLDQLEEMLAQAGGYERSVFVATESVFSMDGDYPDLARIAELKQRHGFCWILDEAHALGWYGPEGSGLARAVGVEGEVDILVGTLGKTLASAGAYTLFNRAEVREHLINAAGEFIYSTAMPPANAAAASAALARVRTLSVDQAAWQDVSRRFRSRLQAEGWDAAPDESPIVPVRLDDPVAAVSLANALRERGILVGAVRPPTVPAGTSRLRISLKRTFTDAEATRVLAAMSEWRKRA